MKRLLALMVFGIGLPFAATAEESDTVSYHRDVLPILRAKCQGCHQPARPLGEYVMTDHAGILKAGETGFEAVVPGNPAESYLLDQITPDDDGSAAMPKEGPALAAAEIDLLRRWIAAGAQDDSPEDSGPRIDSEHPPRYELPPVITSLDYAPDGSLLAVSGYHEVLLHDVEAGELAARLVGLSERIESVAFSPDGSKLAVAGGSPGRFGEIQVWDVAERKLLLSRLVSFDTLYGVSWSGDGTRLAFGAADNVLRAMDATTGDIVLFQGAHDDWVLGTGWAKDDSHLVSVSRDRTLKLTHVETQRFIDNITSITPGALKGGLMCVARHPEHDQALVGGADGVPKLYRFYREQARRIGDDFNLIRAFPKLPGRIYSVAFDGQGERFAAGTSTGQVGTLGVFETASGKLAKRWDLPAGVFAVRLAPSGQQVAAGCFDGKVRLFDFTSDEAVREFVPVPLDPSE